MARKRTIKDPPKRGNLKEHQVQRAVEKVVLGKHGDRTGRSSTWETHHMTAFKIGRDAKTGRFISCKEAKRRKKTAAVETIKIPKKKK